MKEDHFYQEETYSKGLSREDTIEKQVRTCTKFYSKGMWSEFEYSLHMLIGLLPKEIRENFNLLQVDTSSNEVVHRHFQQFIEIQKMLEENTNMIFKKRFIKTYK